MQVKAYSIVIKEIETGNVLVNAETDCILGSFNDQTGNTANTAQMWFSRTNGISLMATILGSIKVNKKAVDSLPDFARETLKAALDVCAKEGII